MLNTLFFSGCETFWTVIRPAKCLSYQPEHHEFTPQAIIAPPFLKFVAASLPSNINPGLYSLHILLIYVFNISLPSTPPFKHQPPPGTTLEYEDSVTQIQLRQSRPPTSKYRVVYNRVRMRRKCVYKPLPTKIHTYAPTRFSRLGKQDANAFPPAQTTAVEAAEMMDAPPSAYLPFLCPIRSLRRCHRTQRLRNVKICRGLGLDVPSPASSHDLPDSTLSHNCGHDNTRGR